MSSQHLNHTGDQCQLVDTLKKPRASVKLFYYLNVNGPTGVGKPTPVGPKMAFSSTAASGSKRYGSVCYGSIRYIGKLNNFLTLS